MTDRTSHAPNRVRLTAASKLKRFQTFIKMNWHYSGGLNPVLLRMLGQTTAAGTFTHAVLDKLDDEGIEVSMRAAQASDEGAIELDYSKSGRTARLLLTYLTAEWPGLKVPKGRLRSIPVEFREDETPPYLALKLKETTVEVAPSHKKGSGAQAGGGEQATAVTTGEAAAAKQQPEPQSALGSEGSAGSEGSVGSVGSGKAERGATSA